MVINHDIRSSDEGKARWRASEGSQFQNLGFGVEFKLSFFIKKGH